MLRLEVGMWECAIEIEIGYRVCSHYILYSGYEQEQGPELKSVCQFTRSHAT
jgi:hypothetical protein